ncbi:MAG: hypothetical protein PVG53_03590 [Holophagae bacterium]|jgi:hypothetical protein
MNKRLVISVAMVFGVLVVASSMASAADPVIVKVPFSFVVRDITMPAGRYEIRAIGNEDEQIQVQSLDVEKEAVTVVITRTAQTGLKEPEVVFDTAGGTHVLSEIREPGIDGYLVHATKGPHTKERIKAEVKTAHAGKRM